MEKINSKWYRDEKGKIINYETWTEYDKNGYDYFGHDKDGFF